ncbi:unnamed protein product [Rhizoctonia solani]|uniref:BTB domain-containing protein n=1 Tax=Rhizoctonia solani TaxID=456999 RepID=A0A8H2X384_9AGAM|nr:unnamed protein product [Rhizoctonia solani]
MPKRPNNPESNFQSSSASSQKRVKVEEINEQAQTALGQVTHAQRHSLNVEPPPSNDLASSPRDSVYYFEDGNLIFRVNNILFKVHASLLKLRSRDFEKVFHISSTNSGSESRGKVDGNPIPLPGILSFQFRDLMKVIYAHPLDRTFSSLPAEYEDKQEAAKDFIFYMNVASLSRRFAMGDTEAWAKERLVKLAHRIGDDVLDGFIHLTCDDVGRDQDHNVGMKFYKNSVSSFNYPETSIVEAIRYARDVSDASLLHDSLHSLQYFCSGVDPSAEFVLAFFRISNLRKTEPSLFGHLFVVLLALGSNVWTQKMFTHMDRMALFSAQCFLNPLPDSLKTSSDILLFTEPTLQQFSNKLYDHTVQPSCFEKCYRTMFSHWQWAFEEHYDRLADKDLRVPIKALVNLPISRRQFSDRIKRDACARECYRVVLGKLDQATQDLYTRLAEYYKPID